MKTSKEVLAVIADKVRENIINRKDTFTDIQFKGNSGKWFYELGNFDPDNQEYRIKPETITINGVDIPKPLKIEDIRDLDKETNYYIVCCASTFYDTVCIRYMNIHKPMFAYLTEEEAIEASKLLFGIKE